LAPADRRAQNKDDSCADCHMPHGPSRNIAHMSFTDHRIVRAPDRPPVVVQTVRPGDIPLLHFHRDLVGGREKDLKRDLALAMTGLARNPCPEPVRKIICERALFTLEEAGHSGAEDAASAEARRYALWVLNRPREALAALETALAAAPRREVALEEAGQIA